MDLAAWFTPDRLVAIVIVVICVVAAVKVTQTLGRTLLTILSALSMIYYLCPSLYHQIINVVQTKVVPFFMGMLT